MTSRKNNTAKKKSTARTARARKTKSKKDSSKKPYRRVEKEAAVVYHLRHVRGQAIALDLPNDTEMKVYIYTHVYEEKEERRNEREKGPGEIVARAPQHEISPRQYSSAVTLIPDNNRRDHERYIRDQFFLCIRTHTYGS